MTTLPSSYNPVRSDEFVGPARLAAEHIDRLTALALPSKAPLRLILTGKPGIGKTKLANYFVVRLGGNKWNTHKFNGAQVKVEEVEDLTRSLCFKDLFGGYQVVQIEEIDKMPAVARGRMLTFCDDMPVGTALVATTNLSADEMRASNPATQRRYTWIELDPPSASDIQTLLETHWPEIGAQGIRSIAEMACGCVGWALQEADAWLAQAPRTATLLAA
jgi:replication-associated recombination protein RarA